jgi:hypothetical protein
MAGYTSLNPPYRSTLRLCLVIAVGAIHESPLHKYLQDMGDKRVDSKYPIEMRVSPSPSLSLEGRGI